MILKYNIEIKKENILNRLQNLINQIYKLLPIREEGSDWEKPLQTIIEQLAGMNRLFQDEYSNVTLPLIYKLEGIYTLTQDKDFPCYRRTIFECLGLMNALKQQICRQN